jgi:hypothetical protein
MASGYRLRGLLSLLLNGDDIGCFLDTVSRGATEVCEEFYDTLRKHSYPRWWWRRIFLGRRHEPRHARLPDLTACQLGCTHNREHRGTDTDHIVHRFLVPSLPGSRAQCSSEDPR